MILAVMSLEQWMEIHTDESEGIRRLNSTSWRAALEQLQMTDIRLLLLASDNKLIEKFEYFFNTIEPRLEKADELLLIRKVTEDSEEAYTEALRAFYRDIPAALQLEMMSFDSAETETIVSFTPLLQQIDEFFNLSCCNPGPTFEHYHAWVASSLPIFPSQHTIVLSVGELIKQDKTKMVSVLIPIVLRQLSGADVARIISQVGALIAEHEQGPEGYIYQLKMGFMEESVFDEKMIASIQQRIGLNLSPKEFNQIWQSTNPNFDQFKPKLEQVNARAIRRDGYALECVGYTNIKDMTHLLDELHKNDAYYETKNGQLIGIAGLPLFCSFIEQKSRVDLLHDIIKKLSSVPSFLSPHSQQQRPMHPVYFVTSETSLSPSLAEISRIQGVSILLGWDGSPIQDWVTQQLAVEKEEDLRSITPHYAGSMG